MPRTVLAKTAAGTASAGGLVALTAADASSQNYYVSTGRELVIAWNSGATPRTVTITSVADEKGRLGHITAQAISAGARLVYGPIPKDSWAQSSGEQWLEASHAEVKFAVIAVP